MKRSPRRTRERPDDRGSRLKRDRYSKKLRELLTKAPEQTFMHQIWAVRALSKGRADLAARLLSGLPEEPWEFGEIGPIPPWHLEGLANLRLTLPPFAPNPDPTGRYGVFRTDAYQPLRNVAGLLHAWEDAESGLLLRHYDVMKEMPRLTHRQFEWQRGFTNGPGVYRWAYLYAGPKAQAHFASKHSGLSTPDFLFLGFAIRGVFDKRPVWPREAALRELEAELKVPRAQCEAALNLIARTYDEMRRLAVAVRNKSGGPAYQPSVLRIAPIIAFDGGRNLVAPIPSLITLRVTSGLFYDHADAPTDVRNEVGGRFETYVRELLAVSLPGLSAGAGELYKDRGRPIAGADAVVTEQQKVHVVLECKARKMSFDARFAERWDDDPGHEELAKGVYQLWRFFAHHRLEIAAGPKPDKDTKAVLVTLEPWMQMSVARQKAALARAEELAAELDPRIEAADRRTIIFCSIEELETTLARTDTASFLESLELAMEERFMGWMLPDIFGRNQGEERPYPFASRLGEVLPWWSRLGADADETGE